MLLRTGTSIGLSGYNVSERGYEGETLETTETEYLPGFLLNSLQVGLGSWVSPQFYLAFTPGIWFSEDFSRFAFTPGALMGKYSFLSKPITPILSFQGGIFIEQPISLFGVFVNPAVGVEFGTPGGISWFVDCGYLFTYWGQDSGMIDDTGKEYLNIDEDIRHSISLSTGILL